MMAKAGDVVLVFDPILWGGKDVGDNSQYWKPATVEHAYLDNNGQNLADVRFHHDGRVSHGHFVGGMKKLEENNG